MVSAPTQTRKPVASIATHPMKQRSEDLRLAVLDAEQGDTTALLHIIGHASARRRAEGTRSWREYRLWRYVNETLPCGVINPNGAYYERKKEVERKDAGNYFEAPLRYDRFEQCDDQVYCDRLNAAARYAGIDMRVETKHAVIMELLCAELFAGQIEWTPVLDGWETTKVIASVGTVTSDADYGFPPPPLSGRSRRVATGIGGRN